MYGIRFADMVFGPDALSPREILAVLRWMPDTTPYHASVQAWVERTGAKPNAKPDPDDATRFHGWGRDRLLWAEIANRIEDVGLIQIAINTPKGKKDRIPKPQRVRTPWTVARSFADVMYAKARASVAAKLMHHN